MVADSSATFEVDPQDVMPLTSQNDSIIHQGWGRNAQSRISFSDDKRYYLQLTFNLISKTDFEYIFDFFNNPDIANGNVNSFYYTPDNSFDDTNTYVVRFVDNNLNGFFRNVNIYGFSTINLEVLGKKIPE